MEAFYGALIGAILGVPITALLMAYLFKPNKSFEVKSFDPDMLDKLRADSGSVPQSFKYPEQLDPTPTEMSLDPNIKQ